MLKGKRLRGFPFVNQQFEQNTLTWDSPTTDLKYVKQDIGARLADAGIHVLRDVPRWAAQYATAEQVADELAAILAPPDVHRSHTGYLARPFNRMGFNAVADVLDVAVVKRHLFRGVTRQLHTLAIDAHARAQAALAAEAGMPAAQRNRIVHDLVDHPIRVFLVEVYNEQFNNNSGKNAIVLGVRRCPCLSNAKDCGANPLCSWHPSRDGRPPGCVGRLALEQPDPSKYFVPGEFFAHGGAKLRAAEQKFGPFIRTRTNHYVRHKRTGPQLRSQRSQQRQRRPTRAFNNQGQGAAYPHDPAAAGPAE